MRNNSLNSSEDIHPRDAVPAGAPFSSLKLGTCLSNPVLESMSHLRQAFGPTNFIEKVKRSPAASLRT